MQSNKPTIKYEFVIEAPTVNGMKPLKEAVDGYIEATDAPAYIMECLNRLATRLGSVPMAKVSTDMVRERYSINQRCELEIVRAFFDWGRGNGYFPRALTNPAGETTIDDEIPVLTTSEVEKLRATGLTAERQLMICLAMCGVRTTPLGHCRLAEVHS